MSGSVEDMSQCAPLGVTCLLFQLANTKGGDRDRARGHDHRRRSSVKELKIGS
ncbi:hypothetical protein F2Q68_00016676 [Brassica cretica]|uniref:Uncharacterized protein n=1 Tax=Brassica cretica TaxID=69181 RepID=A0A8S9HNE0_BRACR|nr:hypothetical protein F2Q68_00016676 [Brassica cretica]